MKERVLTASVLAPVVLGAFLIPVHWPAAIILDAFLAFGLIEAAYFYFKDWEKSRLVGVAAALPAVGWMLWSPQHLAIPFERYPFIYGGLVLAGLLLCNIHALKKDNPVAAILGLVGAVTWVNGGILSFWHLVASQDLANGGITYPVLLCLLPVWAGDIAAIFVGRRIGRHPLMPSLSPNKTWEGSIANLVACAILALIVAEIIVAPVLLSVMCGITCGIVGQVGDLFESLLKRTAGLKDSGNLLPGHGGVLDRIDSLLFAGAGVATLLALFPLGK